MLYKIRDLKRVHGDNTILDIDALELDSGRIYTLIGPNGAGKTTLLNILAFLDMPTAGKVRFQGKPVRFSNGELYQLRQKVSLLAQYPILFTGSVRKNIEYGLKLRRVAAPARRDVVERVLEMVGMSRFVEADAHKLSGGETKRVALARALAIEPQVLLCDEPTANVDTENQEIILEILKRCNREQNVSLIFATHYLSQSTRLADSTIILQNGRLSSGRRENVFQATLMEKHGGLWLYQLDSSLTLQVAAEQAAQGVESCSVNIDPKRITLHRTAPAGERAVNCWSGTIKKLERVNGGIKMTVDCGLQVQVLQPLVEYQREPRALDEQVVLAIPVDGAMFR